jgi:hypothetical protein
MISWNGAIPHYQWRVSNDSSGNNNLKAHTQAMSSYMKEVVLKATFVRPLFHNEAIPASEQI